MSCGSDCETGFEGDNCDVLSNTKFYGVFTPTDANCGSGTSGTAINRIIIAAHSNGNPTEVTIDVETSSIFGAIDGTIVDGDVSASGQWGGAALEIDGNINNDLVFDSVVKGAGFTCDITFEK